MSEGDKASSPSPEDCCCHHKGLHENLPGNVNKYVEITFKGDRRGFYFNEIGLALDIDRHVIVEAEKGIDLGRICSFGETAYVRSCLKGKSSDDHLKQVLRFASDEDIHVVTEYREKENTAFEFCLAKIEKLGLSMKLVDVEYQFDKNRITFYFTADGRVDFRELVKELASEFRTRIELRQIGPRDEARRMGGFGNCGRELCCSLWLDNFEPISTGMARLQNLTLNPFKLAGQCGRLKCCLAFESQVYEDQMKRFPAIDSLVKMKKGSARVEKVDIFQDSVYLHYEKTDEWEKLQLEEFKALTAKS